MKNSLRFVFLPVMLLLVFQCTHSPAQAGTWEVIQQTPSVMLNDLHFLPDGLHGWAVGTTSEGGYVLSAVLKTTDGGQSWNKVGFPAGNSVGLNTVFFVNPDTGWVAGSNGIIYKTLNGGIHWVSQPSGTGRKLFKLFFISETEGWATGGWGDGNAFLVLHTSNGGASWQNQSFGTTSYSTEDIFFFDENTGWISGRDNSLAPHIHKTIDGGQTWTRQNVPLTSSNTSVVSIEFATRLKGWAAISSIYATPAGAVLYTEDGGETWNVQTYTNQSYNYLCVQDDLRVAVVGYSILPSTDEKVLVTTDGGNNWGVFTPPIRAYTNGIQYFGDAIWLASINSMILKSPDNGVSWEWQNISAYLRSLPWKTPDEGFAMSGSSTGTDNYTYHTTDGGITWPADLSVPGGADGMFLDGQHGWMLWEGNSARVWKTVDGGGTWTAHYVGGSGWTGGIFFATPDTGWAFGSNGKLRFTANGGVTWTSQSPGVSNYIQSVFFISPTSGWAAGGYGGGNGFILVTQNAGANWDAQTPASSSHILDLFFLNEDYGWATEVGGGIQRTTDGGHTWQSVSSLPHSFAEDILMIDEMNGWLIANNGTDLDGKGFIYRTENGGSSWIQEYQSPWPNSNLSALSLQPGNILWACGMHNTILQYSIPVGLGKDIASDNKKPDAQCFPNPFTTGTTFSFTLPEDSPLEINIFDLTGRKVSTILRANLQAGTYAPYWDGCDDLGIPVSTGIYIVRLALGNDIRCLKIIRH